MTYARGSGNVKSVASDGVGAPPRFSGKGDPPMIWRLAVLGCFLLAGITLAIAKDTPVATVAEIVTVMRTAQAGDTLTMTAGTWNDVRLVFEGNGLPDRPILLRASAYGAVTVTGASNLRIAG